MHAAVIESWPSEPQADRDSRPVSVQRSAEALASVVEARLSSEVWRAQPAGVVEAVAVGSVGAVVWGEARRVEVTPFNVSLVLSDAADSSGWRRLMEFSGEVFTHLRGMWTVLPEVRRSPRAPLVLSLDALREVVEASQAFVPTPDLIDAAIEVADVEDRPTVAVAERARVLLGRFRAAVCEGGDAAWKEPHIAASSGEVSFEWWAGERTLSLYVTPDGDDFSLITWGVSIVDQMKDEPLGDDASLAELWRWLHGSRAG